MAGAAESDEILVNDVHSRLNETRVWRVVTPRTAEEVQAAVRSARAEGRAISVCGGRHAMGGQQFGTDALLIDLSALDRVLELDAERGEVEVQAGIQWPALIRTLVETQRGQPHQWGITQKQTGADRLSVGGALAANVHGRGLRLKPIVDDVVSFQLVDAAGELVHCDRQRNRELFGLVIGGYGLFGIVVSARLRLTPRRPLERVVEVLDTDGLMAAFEERIAQGFLYGDFQFSIDTDADDFLHRGVFSCYRPVASMGPPRERQALSADDWRTLLYLAHTDKRRAVDTYTAYYLSTSGQLYWSDTHQLAEYVDNYHQWLDARLPQGPRGTEIISELYVPKVALADFLRSVSADFREHRVELVYGTIRLIERDDDTFLPWARDAYACVIFNLHTEHSAAGIERSARAFRRLIELATDLGGSFYLTYHRFATRAHVEACYPRFAQFLALKRAYDPELRFQSDWYRHYAALFEGDAE
jgi:FAD/FMN-containing dehydrogenase